MMVDQQGQLFIFLKEVAKTKILTNWAIIIVAK